MGLDIVSLLNIMVYLTPLCQSTIFIFNGQTFMRYISVGRASHPGKALLDSFAVK
jgi:hypothetical protein